ncbi:MAG: 30S ribosomal protein S18 [Oscillospiraceae bacterium]|nr:30S ribosomal protein S18 [Oscillospiraceae bacterium]
MSYGKRENQRENYKSNYYRKRRKVCSFCVKGVKEIDYKEVSRLRCFLSERAKILPRRATGACAKHQRGLSVAIKRSRQLAMLPYISD